MNMLNNIIILLLIILITLLIYQKYPNHNNESAEINKNTTPEKTIKPATHKECFVYSQELIQKFC